MGGMCGLLCLEWLIRRLWKLAKMMPRCTAPTHRPIGPGWTPSIRTSLLRRLRRRIRRYVWLEGLAAAVAWLGVAFWLSLLPTGSSSRRRRSARRCSARSRSCWSGAGADDLPPRLRAAQRRQHGHADRAAIPRTSANPAHGGRARRAAKSPRRALAGRPAGPHLRRLAAQRLREVELSRIFNPRPLCRRPDRWPCCWRLRRGGLRRRRTGGAWASGGGAWSVSPTRSGPAARGWSVEGFYHGRIKVARGSDVDIVVRADTRMPRGAAGGRRSATGSRAAGRPGPDEPPGQRQPGRRILTRNIPTPSATCLAAIALGRVRRRR